MEALREYLWAVFWTKWAGMFALLVGIDEFLEWTVPRYRVRLNQMFSQGTRRKILLVAFLIFIFVAGFLAWKDESVERLNERGKYLAFEEVFKGKLREAHEKIAKLEAQPRIGEEAQAKIDSLTQTIQQLRKDIDTGNQTNQQLQKDFEIVKGKQERQERQASPWVLTEDQKRKLKDALGEVQVGVTYYKLRISVIPGCPQCAGYTNDLGEVWKKVSGWDAQGSTEHALNPRLVGVNVVSDMAGCLPEELQFVMDAFTAAEIKYQKVLSGGKLGLGCLVLVGNRPQE